MEGEEEERSEEGIRPLDEALDEIKTREERLVPAEERERGREREKTAEERRRFREE